ncbi:UTP11-like U3 small nucleolar ribonucleoprotein [Operophtera brumata]|uniref:U3 small nucleolar RNA-associated protein 11 n=1 Tax=Operophtera brumata TaxID=104452 RepID=A0A0L7KN25_OPEBR|nr:UTP11-like U3 small nucleolar ribonucleoprotein [Operophtera brumata]
MSSWKKAGKANQKTHRERHQPESRKHLGLLEKKKDYKKRADDYHEKGETLKVLRKRALDKNPDEFYFHMINSKVQNGEHHELEKEDVHTTEQVKLMQTQDVKYINMKRVVEKRRIERLQRLDTHPELINRKSNRPRMSDLANMKLPSLDEETLASHKKEKRKIYNEIAKRIDREKELTLIQQKMELKRHLQDPSLKVLKPKRLKPGSAVSAPIYQFQYSRKK